MTQDPNPIITQLASEIGGEINEKGELCVGAPERPIYIQSWDNGKLLLGSQHPLYTVTKGNVRRVNPNTDGEDAGWYWVAIAPKHLRTALDLALGLSDPVTDDLQFAYECILRDYCAQNPAKVEPGLTLYEHAGVRGVEYPAGGRFIDVLALDADRNPVVIEFKLSRGHDQVLGQLLYYIEWIRQNPPVGSAPVNQVRGIIVARHISDALRLAAYSQPNISLVEYSLSVTFTPQERERYAGESRHWDTQGFDDPSAFSPNPNVPNSK